MKKGIRIFLMIVVVVLVFAGVQWVPNIVNQMQEKKDLGQAVITKDSTSKKNIGMQLSYAEKMDILSTSPNQLYLFKTKNKNQLLEYDGKFFEKLNTQLKKFTELKIMDFSRLSKNLEKSFKQASYYSIQQEYGTNGFPIWILSFSYKNSFLVAESALTNPR